MAVIKSCCCWKSLRKGCYASAIYTGIYYLLTFIIMFVSIYDERHYYIGTSPTPKSESLLEPEELSPTTMVFQLITLVCSFVGIITSLLLAYGINKNKKFFLVPWILTVLFSTLADVAHVIFIITSAKVSFSPETSFLYTTDFFLVCLHVYCLLCVFSQYQEYKAGRGTEDSCAGPVRYTIRAPPTITTGTYSGSSRRQNTTSAQELNSPGFTSIDSDRQSSRKQVQFGGGDISPDLLHAHWKENNTPSIKGSEGNGSTAWILPNNDNRVPSLDTLPLICTPNPSPTNEKK